MTSNMFTEPAQIETLESLSSSEIKGVFDVWNRVYPQQINYENTSDFEVTLSTYKNPSHYLLKINQQLIGWCCVFDRDDARWFALIVDTDHQHLGFGTRLLNNAKENEKELFGWMTPINHYIKKDGSTYQSPKAFYIKNGFTITKDVLKTDTLSTVKIHWRR